MKSAPINATTNTTEDYLESISIWYFVISLTTWFFTPILVIFFSLRHEATNFPSFASRIIASKEVQYCYQPLFYVAKILLLFVSSAVYVYIVIPLGDILGHTLELCLELDDRKRELHDIIRGSKLFEQFGEAIPQLALNVFFLYYNNNLMDKHDLIYSIATMTLSAGSILTGIFMGARYCNKCGWPGVSDNSTV